MADGFEYRQFDFPQEGPLDQDRNPKITCCCLKLKSMCLIIGWLNIMMELLYLTLVSVKISSASTASNDTTTSENRLQDIQFASYIELGILCVLIFVNGLFIVGVCMKNTVLVQLFVGTSLVLVLLTITGIVNKFHEVKLSAGPGSYERREYISVLSNPQFFSLNGFWLVVSASYVIFSSFTAYCYYLELSKEEERERNATVENPNYDPEEETAESRIPVIDSDHI